MTLSRFVVPSVSLTRKASLLQCEENVYSGEFRFIHGSWVKDIHGVRSTPANVHPDDAEALFTRLMEWGKEHARMTTFEVDFMSYHFLLYREFRVDDSPGLDNYARWLIGVGAAAEKTGVYMQLCMAQPRDVLLALHVPRATQIRASQDYAGCKGWDIGASSLLLWALGIAPSKDVFWTRARQPANPYADNPQYHGCRADGAYEHDHPLLDALIATHSGGPVGIGDGKNLTFAATAYGCGTTNGTILGPAKPWTLMERAFEDDAQLACGGVCALWQANGAADSYSVIAVNVTAPLTVSPARDLWPAPPADAVYAVWNWHGADTRCANGSSLFDAASGEAACAMRVVATGAFNAADPASPFALPFGIHVVTPLSADGWAIIGEMGSQNHVSLSPRRFAGIQIGGGLAFTARGAPHEDVDVAIARPREGSKGPAVERLGLRLPASGELAVRLKLDDAFSDDQAVALRSSLLHVWLAPDSPRILNYTYSPTGNYSYSFLGSVRGGEGFRPLVSINGGAVTCGEFGFSTKYANTSISSTDYQMTMSCAYNYATLPELARGRGQLTQSGPVTVILRGSVRVMPPLLPVQEHAGETPTANGCLNASVYCPVLADCYQACVDEHRAGPTPDCYQNACCPSHSFGAYNISSLGFYECNFTPCLSSCTKALGPPAAPTPHPAPSAAVEWSIASASSSEPSVPVRDIDLIGFEFLTLRGWSTELGTNPPFTPTFSTSDPCFIAMEKSCGGKDEAQQCAMCYLEHRAEIDPHCGDLPAKAQRNYTGPIVEMLPHACGMPRTGCFYTPDDFPSSPSNVGSPACTGISETYWVDDWHRVRNDGMEMQSGTRTGQLNANAVCLDGARSRHNGGPIQSVQAGGWSADRRAGAALISTQHHLPFNAGPKSFDAPERCQIFTISSATIKAHVRCGTGLPFSTKVGFFGDLNADGSVDERDIALWRRSQIPDADPQYFGNMVYKLGVDYTSDYLPSHNWTRLPFLPPSEAPVGSPSLPYEGYSALEWISNMSVLADGMPQTPILMGWQRDAAWWLFGAVNDQVGGEAALRKLHGLAKQRYNATLSYHINTLESFAVIGDGKPPNTAWSSPVASPEFDSHSQCKRNIDHSSGWEQWGEAWMRWPFAGPDCHVSATREYFLGNRSARINALFDHVPLAAGGTIHIDAWRDNGRSYEQHGLEHGWGWIGESEENICAMVRDYELFHDRGISIGTEGPNGVAHQWLGLISFFWHGDAQMFSPAHWGKIISNNEMGLDNDMSPNACPCPNVVACNCLHGFENIADRVYWKLRLVQLALTDELLITDAEQLHFGAGGRLRLQHLLVLPDDYALGQQTSMKGVASRYAIHHAAKDTPPSTWPYGGEWHISRPSSFPVPLVHSHTLHCKYPMVVTTGDSIPIVQPDLGGATFLPALLNDRKGKADPRRIYAYQNCGRKNLGTLAPQPCVSLGPVTRSWILPLSWAGQNVSAATITPTGVTPNTPRLDIAGRNLTLDLTPGRPVRLICESCERHKPSPSLKVDDAAAEYKVSFGVPQVVGSSNVTHSWFPIAELELGETVLQLVSQAADGGGCPPKDHPNWPCAAAYATRDRAKTWRMTQPFPYPLLPENSNSKRVGNLGNLSSLHITCANASCAGQLTLWGASNDATFKQRLVLPLVVAGVPTDLRQAVDGLLPIMLKDGSILIAMYGYTTNATSSCSRDRPSCYSLFFFSCADPVSSPANWEYISRIGAVPAMVPQGGSVEGPCEPALCQLPDGRVFVIFRVGSYHAMWGAISSDGGSRWGAVFPTTTWAVSPNLIVMPSGAVVLTAGRPSIGLWVSAFDTTPPTWHFTNVIQQHNSQVTAAAHRYPDIEASVQSVTSPHYSGDINATTCNAADTCNAGSTRSCANCPHNCTPCVYSCVEYDSTHCSSTTSYTGLALLDDETLMLAYDRLANGFSGPPGRLGDADFVFAMTVKITKTQSSRLKADDVGRVRCQDPADCTEELQAALSNATLSSIVIPSGAGPLNTLPLVLNRSNVVLTFEPGAILQARRGFFHGGGDVLLSVERVENVSLVGAGASLRMWRKMILSRSDIAFAVSLTRRVSYRR